MASESHRAASPRKKINERQREALEKLFDQGRVAAEISESSGKPNGLFATMHPTSPRSPGSRPFSRRVEQVEEGQVKSSSRWTRRPWGRKRADNRRRNRASRAARRRNR